MSADRDPVGRTFIVNRDSCHLCEYDNGCEAPSRWYVERCALAPESYLPVVYYTCSRHLATVLGVLDK